MRSAAAVVCISTAMCLCAFRATGIWSAETAAQSTNQPTKQLPNQPLWTDTAEGDRHERVGTCRMLRGSKVLCPASVTGCQKTASTHEELCKTLEVPATYTSGRLSSTVKVQDWR